MGRPMRGMGPMLDFYVAAKRCTTVRKSGDREPIRYRFGLTTADFLICRTCGVYVAAIIDIEGQNYSVLNLNAFEHPHTDVEAVSTSYGGESVTDRTERRRRVWTPTQILDS